MNLGRLCQIILKSDKEMSGYGQLAQREIFAYHMVRHTPLIVLPSLRFPGLEITKVIYLSCNSSAQGFMEMQY